LSEENIIYRFRRADGEERSYSVRLEPETCRLLPGDGAPRPAWAALEHHRCPDCTLLEADGACCPAALGLAGLLAFFGEAASYDEADVSVETGRRTYSKRVPLQDAAGSLIGLVMASSGCPVLDPLRPLAGVHLPFASEDETAFRLVGAYLLGQFLRAQEGEAPDWELAGLEGLFDRLERLNESFCRRLEAARRGRGDAGLNGVIILNTLAALTRMSIQEDSLARWRGLYKPLPVEGERLGEGSCPKKK